MDDIDAIIRMLKEISDNRFTRNGLITEFQKLVLDKNFQVASAEVLSALRDLALDLDYFESNPNFRKEDRSFYGEGRLKAEIDATLGRIKKAKGP